MPQFSIFPYDTFPPALKWQAVSFMRVTWPAIFSGDQRWSAETYPNARRPIHFVVAEDELLISYATLMELSLTHVGTRYRVAAFGNVFTFPSFRGEGYGRRVVDGATAWIHSSQVDVAMLFCHPGLEGWYRTSGWTATPAGSTRIGTADNYTVDHDVRMMLWLSATGQRSRRAFETEPLYLPWPW